MRHALFLRLLHCFILGTQWLYEFVELLKLWYAKSDFILQIITFGSRCFICSLSKSCQWRCNEVWEMDRMCAVKWKICNKYHENAPLWVILGVKYISGWSYSKWRTHTQRINGTSNVFFFFVMHHYEAVNLSARGICALWSPSWPGNYCISTLSPFTVGGGTYGEKIDQTKLRQQVFYCSFSTTFTWTLGTSVFFGLILMKSLVNMWKIIIEYICFSSLFYILL